MRKTTLLKSLLLLCALIVGSSAWAAEKWVKTSPVDLKTGDIVVLVNLAKSEAMANDKGTSSAPTSVGVSLNDGQTEITSEVGSSIQWTVTATGTGDSRTYQLSTGDNYLYVTKANNGVRVGNGERNTFTIVTGGENNGYYLYNEVTEPEADKRYIGEYNSQDWRCYTSINNNIKVNNNAFYKKVEDESAVATPTFSPIAGAVISGTKVTITCATDRATIYYTTDGTVPTNTSELCGHSPITLTIDKATTIKAKAYYEDMTPSDVATAEYTILPQKSITDVRAQETGEVYTEGVCTSVNGKTAYIQDLGAAIAIYNSAANLDVKAGDKFYVQGTLGTYNGLLQIQNPVITEKHSGYDIPVEEMTIAQVNENATAKQGWYVQIEGAIVTAINSQNVTIKQGENTVVVRYNSTPEDIAIGDAITVKGNIGCFNSTIQIANPTVTVTGLSVTIPSSLYLTFASTKSIDFTGSGITAYTAKAMNKVVVISEIEGNIVPANAGVLLKAEAAGTYAGALTDGGGALSDDNELIGVTVETVVPWESGDKRNYILQNGKFYKATGAKLKAGRAYLSSTYDITASDARLDIVIDGETNAIANVRSQMEYVRGIFNLQGQRVEKAQKGLYIVNGKKVLMK